MQEVWKLVPGLEDYAVSNIGNVKRVTYSLNNMRPRPRKTRIDKDGYVQIVFFKQGRRISTQVHRVVASAFIGLCPPGYQVNHINGVRNDNRLENLEYLTPSENKKHGFRIGISTRLVGEKSATAKLNDAQVREIKRRCSTERIAALAREFGVAFMTISFIKKGKTWRHIAI